MKRECTRGSSGYSDSEKRGAARASLRDEIAASLACHAAIKVNMPLAPEKMRWLIDRLLTLRLQPPVRTDAR